MEGLHLVFVSALTLHVLGTTKAISCDKVAEKCHAELSFAKCYSHEIRNCIRPRLPDRNFGSQCINSSLEGHMQTDYGHRVYIPSEALRRSRRNSSHEDIDMITSVLSSSYFKSDGNILEQRVLGVWVGEQEVNHLSQPITITFRRTNSTTAGLCVFWDDNTGNWSKNGCNSSRSEEAFLCSCDHLSFFAILIMPPEDGMLSGNNLRNLSYIHYCGSALTITLTGLICLMYLKHSKRKLDHSISIHLQLSLALGLLHVTFLLSARGVGHTQDKPITAMCQALGAWLHWALLATFSWMGIEGLHLYLLLVRVFNIYIRRYLLKLSLLGWGLPSVVVVVCAALGVYGPYTLKSDMNSTASVCWFPNEKANCSPEGWRNGCVVVKYVTVHAYLGVVLLFNCVILVLIGCRLCGAGPHPVQGHGRLCRDTVNLIGLSCALGLPWGLAFCSHGPLTHTLMYLFTIFNGLQGVFLFLWVLLVTCRQHKQAELSSNSQSTINMSSLGPPLPSTPKPNALHH